MKKKDIILSPSLICADLCNLEREIHSLEEAGIQSLHVDIIDPHFSPSMPMGLEIVGQLRRKSKLDFDVHIMAMEQCNEFFIRELASMQVSSVTFHVETTHHVEKMLQIIREAGMKAGVALNPATPVEMLEYIAHELDYVLLMLINPGYAGGKSEAAVSYAAKKIADCRRYLDRLDSQAKIVVDGRVSFEVIPTLVEAGAEVLVGGSKSIFRKGHTYKENCDALRNLLAEIA